ncbi:MAG: hypothetical protein B1H13_05920 [Desulfobacteraceae bacterium 4484_190.3]|nr:MAG: hypothetical protein B1H13_05920 [Desulfobacteraceae bacterium 4484_190.3]
MNLRQRFKQFYDQFISLKGTPESIAFGMSIGIFVGTIPIIPFHTIFIIILTYILRQNFTAAYLGSWLISNPLTIPFLYLTQYHFGKRMLGDGQLQLAFNDYSIWHIVHTGKSVACPLLLGGIIMAPFFAVPAYFITYKAVVTIRKKRRHQT